MSIQLNKSPTMTTPAVEMRYTLVPSYGQRILTGAIEGSRLAPGLSIVGTTLEYGAYGYTGQSDVAHKATVRDFAADAYLDANKAIVSAAIAGAAIGTVVPVVGNAVGAVIGLAVGIGTAVAIEYGYQSAGSRDYLKGR